MKKAAFTLAEVLITLAIIGVVAALTIPTVVRNYQKQETVTRLKKTYSALANTTNLAIAEHGPIVGWEFYDYQQTVPGTDMKGSEHFAKTYLMPYLKVSKDCGLEDCKYSATFLNGSNNTGFSALNKYIFILNDGTAISCIFSDYISEGARYANATIYIDVNGSRKPNILGKDIHYYRYSIISQDRPYGRFLLDALGSTRDDLLNHPSL
jgi:prepilin-type N-terminal cleavage/methylation domain-containing protein